MTVLTSNLATGLSRNATTDASGNYTIPSLPAGDYAVVARVSGFQSQKTSITLQVEQTARVDFSLKLGETTATIEVSAAAAVLQTENATVGSVIDSGKILELPLNGRNFIQLAQLLPGVQPGTWGSISVRRGRGSVGQSDATYGATGASANGARDTNNRYYLDGVEMMDYDGMTYSFSPSVDSLSEFKVQTSTYSSEYGGAPGAQVNIITKSGANRIQGTLWEFNRNNQLTSVHDEIAGKDVTSPRLNRNQFGANIGGPVYLPKLYSGRDKTFFFFNWESGYNVGGVTPSPATVPSEAARNGDLSGLTTTKGAPLAVKDPLGAGFFSNNLIPQARLSPEAQYFLKFQAEPTIPGARFNNYYNTPMAGMNQQKNFTGRVDHALTQSDQLFARYVFNDTLEASNPYWGHDFRNNLGRTQNLSFGWTRVFRSNLVNDFRGGWHRFGESEIFGTSNDKAYAIAQNMFGAESLVSKRPIDFGPPSINIGGGLDGSFNMYNLARQIGPRVRDNGIVPFTDSLLWQKGKHFLKFGGEFDRRHVGFNQARDARGGFNFDGTYTNSSLADFLLGYVKTATLNPTPTNTDQRNYWMSGFVNDDWKVAPQLTMTLGVRYDYFQRPLQSDNRYADIYQNGLVVTQAYTAATSPYGHQLIAPDKNNFGPRFGFAWRLPRETVVRGGYGIYYTPEVANAYFQMAEGYQATSGGALAGNLNGVPNLFLSDFKGNPFTKGVGSSGFNNLNSNDQNMRDSYIQQWNLNVQRRLPGNFIVDAGYVGSKGTDLVVTFGDMNQPSQLVNPSTPGVGSVNSRRPNQAFQRGVAGDKSIGNSIYHSAQVKVERRMAAGLTWLTAYTYAKAISGPNDIGGQIGGGAGVGSIQSIYNLRDERSVAGFDIGQRFVQTLVYDVPFARRLHGAAKYVLDGWQVSSITTLQGGFPMFINTGLDTTGTGTTSRADYVSGQNPNLTADQRTWQKWFNTSAFAIPANGSFGNTPRTGAIRLPGMFNMDFSANKSFHFMERRAFELRAEVFNLLNHYNPDPGAVNINIRDQSFGKVGNGITGTTSRVIQLGAKLNF